MTCCCRNPKCSIIIFPVSTKTRPVAASASIFASAMKSTYLDCLGLSIIAVLIALIRHGDAKSQINVSPKRVLLIGGTRFSGLYLWRELHNRGHHVTILNRGKTALSPLPGESTAQFDARKASATFLKANRQNAEELKSALQGQKFDAVYDINGREASDTAPLVEMFNGKVEHFVYMSSAGVYKKSIMMPHCEGDAEDQKSRHKGKLDTESLLRSSGIPFTSIRPTYIYGPLNYNPIEEYFFERLAADRPICIPGNGQHITGLGHVQDLAVAMAQVLGRDVAKGQIYNVQSPQSVTFESLARLCGEAMGKDSAAVKIKLYDKKMFDFGEKKAFPMREQHFFCSVDKAMEDLDWTPVFDMREGLKDSYLNDFVHKKAAGKLKSDFFCDDLILQDKRSEVLNYDGIPENKL